MVGRVGWESPTTVEPGPFVISLPSGLVGLGTRVQRETRVQPRFFRPGPSLSRETVPRPSFVTVCHTCV